MKNMQDALHTRGSPFMTSYMQDALHTLGTSICMQDALHTRGSPFVTSYMQDALHTLATSICEPFLNIYIYIKKRFPKHTVNIASYEVKKGKNHLHGAEIYNDDGK